MLNRIFIHSFAAILALAASGCTTTQVATDFKPETGGNVGVVVFSLAHDLAGGEINEAIIYLDDGLGSGGTNYMSSEKPLVGFRRPSEFSDVYGYLHVVTLPAGPHRFTSWQISNGTGLRIFPKDAPPVLQFEVKPGEIVYLGAFHGHLQRGKNIFGMEITGGGMISVGDASARDLPLLFQRYPQFADKVRSSVLSQGVWQMSPGTTSRVNPVLPVPAGR